MSWYFRQPLPRQIQTQRDKRTGTLSSKKGSPVQIKADQWPKRKDTQAMRETCDYQAAALHKARRCYSGILQCCG
ncbi:hypothetical protein AV530_000330 [Patagioenas fasciata monilis]|uniref:Uncharacterized protein n=1 Tax=Patagioenas fasciata monilis TaxID=372326 RepID=A0A1V4KDM0_PATFA|nr:hypothetical protein AV530_000330 [Patagioenas fasciata monilis]